MKIGPFEILESLGGGGSGTVYKARHTVLDRIVAIKQLNREVREGDRSFERFRREAQLMAAIRCDHVVTLYSFDVIDGRPVLEMECLQSGSLERLMDQGPLPLHSALQIAEDILRGLQALHGAGIVHRDVKPANVLQDEVGRFKLSDFGLSIVESDAKPTLEAATIRYVAPECISDEPRCDFRSDLYSVGMVLYEGILGGDGFRDAFPDLTPAAAFGAKWLGWLKDSTREATPLHILRPEIPVAIAQFAARLMAKDPDMRYASADVALGALTPLVGEMPRRVRISAADPQPKPVEAPAKKSARSRRLVAACLAVAAITIGAGAVAIKLNAGKSGAVARSEPDAPPSGEVAVLVTRVVDETGKEIADAQLRLVPGNTEGRSGADGSFSFNNLQPGTYELTSSARGRVLDVRTISIDARRHSQETITLRAEAPVHAPPPPHESEPPRLPPALEKTPSPAPPPAGPPTIVAPPAKTPPSVPKTVPTPPQSKATEGRSVSAATDDLSRALAARLRALLDERGVKNGGGIRVSLVLSTRPAPFVGRGITADYIATLQLGAGTKSFQGQILGFSELALRGEVVEKAAADIAAYIHARP